MGLGGGLAALQPFWSRIKGTRTFNVHSHGLFSILLDKWYYEIPLRGKKIKEKIKQK